MTWSTPSCRASSISLASRMPRSGGATTKPESRPVSRRDGPGSTRGGEPVLPGRPGPAKQRPEFPWAVSADALEAAGEVELVGEVELCGDFLDGEIAVHQEFA